MKRRALLVAAVAFGSAVLFVRGAGAADVAGTPDASAPTPDANRGMQLFIGQYARIKVKYPTPRSTDQQKQYESAIQQAVTGSGLPEREVQKYLFEHGAFTSPVGAPATPPASAASPAGVGPAAGPSGTSDAPPALTPTQQAASDVIGIGMQAHPDDPEALRMRGMIRSYQHDWRGAFDDLGKAVAQGNPSAQTLAAYSGAAYELGDFPTAAGASAMALKLDPNNQEALSVYHFSVDRAPAVSLPSVSARFGSGVAGLGEMPAGGAAAQAVDAPGPSGMTAAQVAEYARQASAGGQDAVARSQESARDAADALRLNDLVAAYQLATQAVRENPSNAQALNYRAMALNRMGQDAAAVQDASAALALVPGNTAALQTRSLSLAKLGRYREALQDADATLASSPDNAYAWQNKAFALAGLGDRGGAIEALRRSAAADPRFQNRLERALQLPQDADLTLLFKDAPSAGAASVPAPSSRNGRFLRLMILTLIGGVLIALAVLHIASASWREGVRATMRRMTGAPAGAAPQALPSGAGTFWTQYGLVKEIGLGGMGVVYEALDRSLERRVAVKRMRDEIRLDPRDRQRFVNEAKLVAQLHHPNIVDIYGIVEDGADVYLVFEFVEGRTLHDALSADGAMDFASARRVLGEMAAAVEHAHARGVIHRDLKPSNVMLAPDGRVKVMDFGIARQAKDALTRHSMTNTIAGTPPYMAPEQEQGTVRKESDVYALGVCLYEMLTGLLPFGGMGGGMLLNKLNNRLTPARQRVPTLPSGIDEVLARALAADPDKRYRTPAEFTQALAALGSPAPLTPR